MNKLNRTNDQTNIGKRCSCNHLFSRSLKLALFVFIELLIDLSNMINIISYFNYLFAKISLDTGISINNNRSQQHFSSNKSSNEDYRQVQLLIQQQQNMHNQSNLTRSILNSTLLEFINKNLTSYNNYKENALDLFWHCLSRLSLIVLQSNPTDYLLNVNSIFISVVLIRWYLIFSILEKLLTNILDHLRHKIRCSVHKGSSKANKISSFKLTRSRRVSLIFLLIFSYQSHHLQLLNAAFIYIIIIFLFLIFLF
jgi:hypothetical protein